MTAMMQREIAQELQLKWNLDDVDVRTKTVERTLAPLVNQVRTPTGYVVWKVQL
jgi:hypothetical protein